MENTGMYTVALALPGAGGVLDICQSAGMAVQVATQALTLDKDNCGVPVALALPTEAQVAALQPGQTAPCTFTVLAQGKLPATVYNGYILAM